ncbi:GNAT family N-acetyltransferase [Senegalia massiliensis]|uniref:GNAT family N-acetyltransferase n=1 Tax=Senegalia massiliensis TaxID=1720316 RepID=UPI0010312130|nr:GNAT family N-acetyltransferase [Senegalia massiliensis]
MNYNYYDYYKKFLGIENNIKINNKINLIPNISRTKPISENYYYPLICSMIDDNVFCSLTPELYENFKEIYTNPFINNIEDFSNYLSSFCELNSDKFEFKVMYRMVIEKNNMISPRLNSSIDIKVLTKHIVDNVLIFDDIKERQKYWLRKKQLIDERRQFIILKEQQIISWCKVSDIDFKGANIAVFTHPDYRSKKHAQALVKNAISWCFNNGYLPIYWVDSKNLASLKVATNLGFNIKSLEYVIKKK